MKTVKETLLQRRSIRRYERESITPEQMDFIYQAIRNTPTSYNGQQYSVIDITDQELKQKLYGLTGQKQIKTCSHFMAFCSDFHKISLMAREKGVNMPAITNTVDGLILGTVDASLAMMSAVTAAGALGLGTCCIGYARTAAPEEIASLLGLPQGVFLVCGLALGVPREMPDLKPKQPVAAVIHTDRYASDAALLDSLKTYDDEVTHYNTTRSGSKTDNDWATHIIGYYAEAMNYHMFRAIQSQGYDPKK
ncbi:MAG: nitroreductase family protein [Bacteroides sp.]|nr:nitroreductase family protein [Bacteroides sp.]